MSQLKTREAPNWCPGCGNYGIQAALKNAIVELGLDTSSLVIATGIGCGSKINHWVKCYGFEGLHGRPLPVATGIKLANPSLTVLAAGGDGDGYGLGMGHFIHSMRRNLDITYIVQNNQIYGLTTGQTSPTSGKGTRTKSTPAGSIELPVNPIALALVSGATYVARGYAGDVPHLTALIAGAIAHHGFALVDVLQPCVTFNKIDTYDFFAKRVYKLEAAEGWTSDAGMGLAAAVEKAREWGDKIPIGLFYREERPTYEDEEVGFKGGLRPVDVGGETVNVEEVMSKFT